MKSQDRLWLNVNSKRLDSLFRYIGFMAQVQGSCFEGWGYGSDNKTYMNVGEGPQD